MEMALVWEAKTKRVKGISVPMTGITLDTWPDFKALNIKYAPKVQRRVDKDAKTKIQRVGIFTKGMAKIASNEIMLM